MHHKSTFFFLGILGCLPIVPACSTSNNDVGSLQHDGSATGGVSGSTGATGGTAGSGGVTGPLTCVHKGKSYAVGETFTDDCNGCICRAIGDRVEAQCTLRGCVGTGGGPAGAGGGLVGTGGISGTGGGPNDGGVDGASSDGAVASACSECGADELCVAYYDGTCKPMSSHCKKVSAATRVSILVNHERCFARPIGDEICGARDAGVFFGCGEPTCGKDKETLVSDINCYGP